MAPPTDPVFDVAASKEVAAFVARRVASSGAERADEDRLSAELCDVLGVPRPDPVTGDADADRYAFEKDALLAHEGGRGSTTQVGLLNSQPQLTLAGSRWSSGGWTRHTRCTCEVRGPTRPKHGTIPP